MTPDMLRASPDQGSLGRRQRASLSGPRTALAYGDAGSPDLDVDGDARMAMPAYPGHGGLSFGRGQAGYSSFGGLRYPEQQQASPWPSGIGGPGGAYGGGWADGVLTVRDRHVMTRFGSVRNADGGGSSMPSADKDGNPVPPRYQMVDTTESWQLGTDNTANEDNPGPHNTVDVLGTGKRFPLGQQDGTETPVWGPPLSTWREYGARGPVGMHGPDPDVWDPNWVPRNPHTGTAGAGGRGRLVATGAPGMQPGDLRTVYGGVPHGLHSPTAPSTAWSKARNASIPQQMPPRVDRPASSKVAGQSMSQTYPPEGALASRAVPRTGGDRRPGLDDRFRGRA